MHIKAPLPDATQHVCRPCQGLPSARVQPGSRSRLHAKRVADSGYFADADPHAPVYAPMGGVDQTDLTKRGGRYTSDFIWNTKWKDQLDLEVSKKEAKRKLDAERAKREEAAGGLSLRRVADLNSMDVDLSAQLRPRKRQAAGAALQSNSQQGRPGASAAASAAAAQQILFRRGQQQRGGAAFESRPPTQGESRRWERSGRFSKKVSTTASTAPEEVAAAAERAEAERVAYEALKAGLWRWSVGTTAACFGAAFTFYSRDTAASYGVGALGGLMYLRLLNKSVDGLGASFAGAAGGQARFAIPIALALGYNRWNTLAHGYTSIQLELLPMLLGFFTYKFAVIGKQFTELLAEAARSARGSNSLDSVPPRL